MSAPPSHALKLLVVEDEELLRDYMTSALRQLGYRAVRSVASGEEAMEVIPAYEPDVLILDIDLGPGITGIEVARRVRKAFSVALIYLTQFDEEGLVQNALDTQPGAYLLKPFRASQVAIAITQALQAMPSATSTPDAQETSLSVTDAFFVKSGDIWEKVPFSEVLFIRADRRYSELVTAQGTHIVSTSLQNLMEQIPSAGILRVHRSYAVRLAAVSAFTSQSVQVGNQAIPVSEPYREALRQALDPNTLRSK